MKSRLSLGIMLLLLASIIGILGLIIHEATLTPQELMTKAAQKIKEQDFPAGARLMIRAADSDYAPAQYELALMYDVGDKIPENREKAILYMNKALSANMPEAHYVMAVWSERGYFGTPDTNKIIQHYETAAQSGHKNAMKTLIVLYDQVNPERQRYWMNNLNQKEKIK